MVLSLATLAFLNMRINDVKYPNEWYERSNFWFAGISKPPQDRNLITERLIAPAANDWCFEQLLRIDDIFRRQWMDAGRHFCGITGRERYQFEGGCWCACITSPVCSCACMNMFYLLIDHFEEINGFINDNMQVKFLVVIEF